MKLTIVIRNDGPMVYAGDSPSYRTVVIELTEEQKAKIILEETHSSGGTRFYESISQVILEPEE